MRYGVPDGMIEKETVIHTSRARTIFPRQDTSNTVPLIATQIPLCSYYDTNRALLYKRVLTDLFITLYTSNAYSFHHRWNGRRMGVACYEHRHAKKKEIDARRITNLMTSRSSWWVAKGRGRESCDPCTETPKTHH